MFVFTGHRGPSRCRRSKNKSSTDFWSFVWRISPQHFWHIFTFACFCFTELATQQMLFLFVSASSAENTRVLCSKTAITPLPGGWFRHTPISRSQLRRWIVFLKKKLSLHILLNSHFSSYPNSKFSTANSPTNFNYLNSCFSTQNSEFWVRIPNRDAWSLSWKSNCQVSHDQTERNLTTGLGHVVVITASLTCGKYLNIISLWYYQWT